MSPSAAPICGSRSDTASEPLPRAALARIELGENEAALQCDHRVKRAEQIRRTHTWRAVSAQLHRPCGVPMNATFTKVEPFSALPRTGAAKTTPPVVGRPGTRA